MTSKIWRPIISVIVLSLTIGSFVYYFGHNPSVGQQLGRTAPPVLITLFGLGLAGIAVLSWVTLATLRLCRVRLSGAESLLLTAYSAVINFFGPLQSGPAFRAIYLKRKHDLKLKNYTLATLVYYGFFGGISLLCLLSSWLGWWLLILVGLGLVLAGWASKQPRLQGRIQEMRLHEWWQLGLATALQIALLCLVYYLELINVAPGTSLSQAIVYTGAANLALFVSLTPGAIGFRESFLLLSQQLHHISPSTIVAASVLDRAVYILVLLVAAVLIFASHAQRQLTGKDS